MNRTVQTGASVNLRRSPELQRKPHPPRCAVGGFELSLRVANKSFPAKMTFCPLSVSSQNKQMQHRRDRAQQKPRCHLVLGSIFSPSKLFAGTSALHRFACTASTPGRVLQRLLSYAMESGRGMLIILRAFFLFVWFVLLCVALLGRNQCCLTLRVLHVAMRCRAPFNPLMHVFVGFNMFACFLFSFVFSANTWFIIAWLKAQRGASSEKSQKFTQPCFNCISIATGSCFSSRCLFAVSSQSARSDLWPSDINKASFFPLHGRVHLHFNS